MLENITKFNMIFLKLQLCFFKLFAELTPCCFQQVLNHLLYTNWAYIYSINIQIVFIGMGYIQCL